MRKNKKEQITKPVIDLDVTLFERAKKIGLTQEQMDSYGTPENLKAFLDSISPRTNPDARIKQGEVKEPVKREPEKMPSEIALDREELARETNSIQGLVRKLNIKFNTPKITKVVKVVEYDPKSKKIVKSGYIIN